MYASIGHRGLPSMDQKPMSGGGICISIGKNPEKHCITTTSGPRRRTRWKKSYQSPHVSLNGILHRGGSFVKTYRDQKQPSPSCSRDTGFPKSSDASTSPSGVFFLTLQCRDV